MKTIISIIVLSIFISSCTQIATKVNHRGGMTGFCFPALLCANDEYRPLTPIKKEKK